MENFCINCDCKLTIMNETYPLWNKASERLCSKCRNKAGFFIHNVHSHESALDFYVESIQNLLAKDFSPKFIQYLEDYCKYLDKVEDPAKNSSPIKKTIINTNENKIIIQDSADSEKHSRDNFIKSLFKSENTVAKILTVIALIIFILGFIIGLVILFIGDVPFWSVLSYWAGSFITGMLFIGFAEIIKLLQNISNK